MTLKRMDLPKTESEITSMLARDVDMSRRYDIRVNNCYTQVDNEADFFGIRKSGFCDEFEIKVSKSDFLADKNKTVMTLEYAMFRWPSLEVEKSNKHELMQAGLMTPNYFSFVVPKNLVDANEIPDKFGLIYATATGVRVVKQPEKLHNKKLPMEYRYFIAMKAANRYASLIGNKNPI